MRTAVNPITPLYRIIKIPYYPIALQTLFNSDPQVPDPPVRSTSTFSQRISATSTADTICVPYMYNLGPRPLEGLRSGSVREFGSPSMENYAQMRLEVVDSICSVANPSLSANPLQFLQTIRAIGPAGRFFDLLHDQLSPEHVHPAREREFARFLRGELDRRGFECRQIASDPEIAEDHLLAAR